MRSSTNPMKAFVFASCLIVFQLTADNASAQINFAGKWMFDKTKSSPDRIESGYDGTVARLITQKAAVFSFMDIYTDKSGKPFETAADSYTLDGKEIVRTSGVGTQKRIAKWSADKKSVVITTVDTQELNGKPADFIATYTFVLSDDGRTLTVETYGKNPVQGETKSKSVYKKQ